jgi:hypothetical protein
MEASMRALPSLLVFLPALALLLNVYGAAAAEEASRVVVVNKVENEAQVISASGAVTATVGASVHLKDELRTGPMPGFKLHSSSKLSLLSANMRAS